MTLLGDAVLADVADLEVFQYVGLQVFHASRKALSLLAEFAVAEITAEDCGPTDECHGDSSGRTHLRGPSCTPKAWSNPAR